MGSAFPSEPVEWFKGLHVVTFSMTDPDWVMHRTSKKCVIEYPHKIDECGEFKLHTVQEAE